MDHERAFLHAIREHPDDDAPRLIFADWLEEQGGAERTARANFIRIQCRLATVPDEADEREELEDEAADLLAEYEPQWTQPLHGIAREWCFARGFIEHVVIRGKDFLTHAESLFACTPLRSVNLAIHVNDVPHLAACRYLEQLESLGFAHCYLNDRALQQLLTSPYLTRLQTLNLRGNAINTPGIQSLVQSALMPRLRRLDLSQNRAIGDRAIRLLVGAAEKMNLESLRVGGTNVTLNGLMELLRSTSLIRELDLSGNRYSDAQKLTALRSLREPPALKNLQFLDLSETSLPLIRELLASPDLSNLRELHLRNTNLMGNDAVMLTRAPGLERLTRLGLRANNLGVVGISELADSPNIAHVKHLDVSFNNVRDSGAKALAGSPYLTRLRELDCTRNEIGGPGLKALAASANLAHLRTLRLSGNYIGVESVQAVAESPHLTRLRELFLCDSHLEEASARVLAAAPNLARLATLVLRQNQLGDGGARALARSPHLQRLVHLDLSENHLGKAGAEALAASAWRRLRTLALSGNIFTDTQENLLRERFGEAVSC